jgi:TonB-dependent SusC/RagA subfamily outer membrane receptor
VSFFSWMAYGVAVGLLVSGAAWLLDRGLGRASLPTRWVWAGALVLSIGLPLRALMPPADGGPMWSDGAVAMAAAPVDPTLADPEGHESGGPLARVLAALEPSLAWSGSALVGGAAALDRAGALLNRGIERGAAVLPTAPAASRAGLAAWGIGSAAFGAFLLLSLARLGRRRAGWPLARVRGRRVRIAPELGPAVMGIRRPEIVLPLWATRLEPDELELVLAHESEHVRARDPLLLAAGLAVLVAIPWNPAAWWQLRRLRDAVEVDCDRRVLQGGAPARRYGSLLIRLGGQGWKDLLPAAPLGGTPSLLERRLHAMKKRSVRRAIPLTLVAGVAATGLLVLACEADTPTHPPDEGVLAEAPAEETPADAERIVIAPHFADEENRPLFVVDGVIVSQGLVDGLDPERIENVEVVRGAAAAERYGQRWANGVVLITTRGSSTAATESSDAAIESSTAATESSDGEGVGAVRDTEITGRVAGAVVRRSEDDEPGARLIVRSPVSMDSGAEPSPLYVVDGVIMSGSIVDLDAMDIGSIEVVKGAAAAGLYGSRAANGVVVITTRR